jgi:peptide chain release factor 2
LICGGIFDFESKKTQLASLQKKSMAEDLWSDSDKASAILKKISIIEKELDLWQELERRHGDLEVLFEFSESDDSIINDIQNELVEYENKIADLELKLKLGGKQDTSDAILTIHPGAGGTESQDWADMLFRLYTRWIERKNFKQNIMDYQPGDEAGLKDVTLEVKGEYAYGLLKAEAGVHRLVRISPIDANSRRHTSFASVFVYPLSDEEIEIEINHSDLRIDTYRASGAGGQHVNRTDSAVRITHLPTGTVAQCQNERSQHKNKEQAMKVLKARLLQLELEKEREENQKLEDQKMEIGWGSQIRSYVFHPYNMVKDHRTKYETGNVQAVMDGDIDQFIQAWLVQQIDNT